MRHVHDPATVHAMCEDYRAGATIDREHDDADRATGTKIEIPVLALWSTELGSLFDVQAIWGGWAKDFRGRMLDSGHYLAEEKPEEVAKELATFFSGS